MIVQILTVVGCMVIGTGAFLLINGAICAFVAKSVTGKWPHEDEKSATIARMLFTGSDE